MKKISSATIDELEQLEKTYAQKNKRASYNLKNRIGNREEVIFCYYELANPSVFGFGQNVDIYFCVLTSVKLIFNATFHRRFQELMLDEIYQVDANFKMGCVILNISGIHLFEKDIADKALLQNIADSILKAKSNFIFNSRSINAQQNTPISQNSTVEQLEKLADLFKAGVLTEDEYKRAKGRVLSKQ